MGWWETIVVGIASAAGALVLGVLVGARAYVEEFFKDRINARRLRRYSHGLARTTRFLSVFEALAALPCVERYMLMEGKNHGGLPAPGKPYTICALKGGTKVQGRSDPAKLYGFDIPVDAHYAAMLHTIVEQGMVRLQPDAMPQGILRGYYRDEGVSEGVVAFVGFGEENRMIYVSLAKYEGTFSDSDMNKIGLELLRLRSFLAE